MSYQDIKNCIVETMLHGGVTGGKKQQVQTVVNNSVATHDRGRAKEMVDELVQEGIIERYGGGQRANIRLADVDRAVQYLKDNDGDVPFGFD